MGRKYSDEIIKEIKKHHKTHKKSYAEVREIMKNEHGIEPTELTDRKIYYYSNWDVSKRKRRGYYRQNKQKEMKRSLDYYYKTRDTPKIAAPPVSELAIVPAAIVPKPIQSLVPLETNFVLDELSGTQMPKVEVINIVPEVPLSTKVPTAPAVNVETTISANISTAAAETVSDEAADTKEKTEVLVEIKA